MPQLKFPHATTKTSQSKKLYGKESLTTPCYILGLPWRLRRQRIWLQCRRPRFVPGLRRSPGERNGYSLQYSCLENSLERGAWGIPIFQQVKEVCFDQEHRGQKWTNQFPCHLFASKSRTLLLIPGHAACGILVP